MYGFLKSSASAARGLIVSVALVSLAACTQTTLDTTTSSQAPLVQTQVDPNAAGTGTDTAPVTENALASTGSQNSGQSVTEAKIVEAAGVASPDLSKSFTFLPIEGAPQQAVTTLSKSLKSSAQQKGLTLVPGNQSGAKYQIKGYFSALNDGTGTLVVYIWDVVDASGKRLHRINGRERTGTTRTDPWQAITATELSKVADNTADRLQAWLNRI